MDRFERIGDYNLCDICRMPCGKDIRCKKCDEEYREKIDLIFGTKPSLLSKIIRWVTGR